MQINDALGEGQSIAWNDLLTANTEFMWADTP